MLDSVRILLHCERPYFSRVVWMHVGWFLSYSFNYFDYKSQVNFTATTSKSLTLVGIDYKVSGSILGQMPHLVVYSLVVLELFGHS